MKMDWKREWKTTTSDTKPEYAHQDPRVVDPIPPDGEGWYLSAATTKTSLYLGCTEARHRELGVDAVINARGGRLDLNDWTMEDQELLRDARAIRERLARRVRWYGPSSKFFRRHVERVEHLISQQGE